MGTLLLPGTGGTEKNGPEWVKEGSKRRLPWTTSADSNYLCTPGTFRPVGPKALCTVCPAGYYCPYTDVDLQLPCGTGYYALPGQTNCTACPAGYACPDEVGTLTPCMVGEYSGQVRL